ncbi:unnamed protein product [Owenia fusiformis]|uniref:Wee1-like protein kinase n=1 Tax=Owenia fusiformis TaxID=6347 RepID=A0A8J1XJD9_OWEFU|nr:unnamed protein product [Owenia fusiformis]
MSFCRERLCFQGDQGTNQKESGLIHRLNFDSENDGDVSWQDASMSTGSLSPSRDDSIDTWQTNLLSPTPMSSPCMERFSKGRHMSPIPFSSYLDSGLEDTFDSSREHGEEGGALTTPTFTPPHKNFRALRLYDTPHTPKSLLQKCQRRITRISKSKLALNCDKLKTPKPPVIAPDSHHHTAALNERLQANINPFTPSNNNNHASRTHSQGTKRSRQDIESILYDSGEEMDDIECPSSKKIALREINTSRYNEEFHEICKLGDGEFGSVCKCVNRLDGCTYAIKKSKTPVAGSVYERTAMNEVYAHAVLGKHQHVVRYYSAWSENGHMYIQNEFCNGGSLADLVEENRQLGRNYSEAEIKLLLLQLAQGLKYIHSQNLVHLDIKPGNIFIQRDPKILNTPESGMEEEETDDVIDEDEEPPIIYKIGDLGHVTSMANPSVEEGDCRYLPNEILQEDFDHLSKADIFSLALTIYEVASGSELPKNGDSWHEIRQGKLPYLTQYSAHLNGLLKSMIHPDPRVRPSGSAITQHPVLYPFARKSRAQLRRELNEEKFKNELLARQLKEATQSKLIPNLNNNIVESTPANRTSRLVGRKIARSMSMTNF